MEAPLPRDVSRGKYRYTRGTQRCCEVHGFTVMPTKILVCFITAEEIRGDTAPQRFKRSPFQPSRQHSDKSNSSEAPIIARPHPDSWADNPAIRVAQFFFPQSVECLLVPAEITIKSRLFRGPSISTGAPVSSSERQRKIPRILGLQFHRTQRPYPAS